MQNNWKKVPLTEGDTMKRLWLCLILILPAAWLLAACGPTAAPPAATQTAPTAPATVAAAIPTAPPATAASPAAAASLAALTVGPPPTLTAPPSPTSPPPPPPTATPSPTPTMPAPADLFVNLELVAGGFTAPINLADPDDGSGRLFIADQIGLIRILTADGNILPQPLLDLRARLVTLEPGYDERGLLGFVLHPDFATPGAAGAGLFYVYYSAPRTSDAPADYNHTGRLSAFRISAADPNQADPASELPILEIPQPQFNHNGGQLAFGPDGYLYLGLGDGGAQNDSGVGHSDGGNGQNAYALLGSILRLNVNSPAAPQRPYVIPPDNPFADGVAGAPVVFAYGFRNPFRFSFDAGGSHDLFVADVGQNLYEEINLVQLGGNYGWRIREGYTCFNVNNADVPLADCPATGPAGEPLLPPIMVYGRSEGRSVIGGYVYRGSDVPALAGRYVFGDWQYDAQGRLVLFTGVPTLSGEWVRSSLTVGASSTGLAPFTYLLAFGQDANLSVYALTSEALGPDGSTGKLFKLMPAVRR